MVTNHNNSLVATYKPLAYWQLSESSGTQAVDSKNVSDGVYQNDVSLGTPSLFDSVGEAAAEFDGQNDYIEIAHDSAFELGSGSVQLWFNTTTLNGHQGLLSKDSKGRDNGGHFGMWVSEGGLTLRSESSSDKRSLRSETGLIQTNQWHHVTASWGGEGLRLYLDGQQVGADPSWRVGWSPNKEPIVIGADQQASGDQKVNNLKNFFSGQIEDVALFDRTLSEAEIQQLYQAGKEASEVTGEESSEVTGEESGEVTGEEAGEGSGESTGEGSGGESGEEAGEGSSVLNQVPVAQDDAYEVTKGQILTVSSAQGVLSNDSDDDGDTLEAVAEEITTAEGGTVLLKADGRFSYSPAEAFTGTDQFSYTVIDGQGGTGTGTVEIDVTEVSTSEASLYRRSQVSAYKPLAYWQLSESSGTQAADSKNVSDGVYHNDVSLGTPSLFDSVGEAAAEFDGQNDYIEIAHDSAFELGSGSVQLWFNTTTLNGHQGLLSKDSKGRDNGGHFGMWVSEGGLTLRSESSSDKRSLRSETGLIQTNQWHHVTASWGGEGLRLYLDGQQVGADPSWQVGWSPNKEPIVIGADQQASGDQKVNNLKNFFSGQIEDVALFDRKLSEAEIQQLYQAGIASGEPVLNQVPIAQDDTYEIDEGQILTVGKSQGVLSNDSDDDGDTLEAVAEEITTAEGGTVLLKADGRFSYSPAEAFTGTDQFSYTVIDGQGGTGTGTVEIDVTEVSTSEASLYRRSQVSAYKPLAYWQLSESSGTQAADSKNVSDGVYHNDVSLGTPSLFDSVGEAAAEFDGQNDYIEIAHDSAFELGSGSVQLWFNTTTLNGHQGLLSKDSKGRDNGGHFGMWVSEGSLSLRSESSSDKRSLRSETGLIQTNQWHHVTASWGGEGLRLYLDGQQVGADPSWQVGWSPNKEPIVIGADQQASGDQKVNNLKNFFSGQIEDVALFDRKLSEAEIQQLYQAGIDQTGSPDNTPPVVDAGNDLSVTAFAWAGISLSGTVADDGTFTTQWSQKDGPGVAIFDDASSQSTLATFSQPGTYTLQLTANDGTNEVSDEVEVVVERSEINIMPLGDSITHGGGKAGGTITSSYRRSLWKQLQAENYNVDFVGSQTKSYTASNGKIKLADPIHTDFDLHHEGHSGWRADEILNGSYNSDRLGDNGQSNINLWANSYNPDMVLLHLGTNDIIQNQSANSTISDLEGIIDRLQAIRPNISILIAQIIPYGKADKNKEVEKLNAKIPALAAKKNKFGSPVKVVNQFDGYHPSTDSKDNAHPNNKGDQKVADNWFTAIEDLAYYGNELFGRGRIDTLTGHAHEDTFVLGNFGDPYYNDGLTNSSGLEDYALIKNFQKEKDLIQLVGAASDYLTQVSPIVGIAGKAIYWDANKSGADNAELIGIVEGVDSLDLGSKSFLYV